jgi:acetylornithine/succinyldiaminopimelate/putrescine aminotransferase
VPFSSTPASTACEPVAERPSFGDTCAEMLRLQIPNFFRLYLNPYVVQACHCLSRYAETSWPAQPTAPGDCPSFLANSFDEALAGAIKLARYSGAPVGRSPVGLVIDPSGRLGPFASVTLENGGRVEFIPDLVVAAEEAELDAHLHSGRPFGFIVLVPSPGRALDWQGAALRGLIRQAAPLVITCVDRTTLSACRQGTAGLVHELTPDIVIFDESFVNREVPFAAFTGRKDLFDHWNRPGRSTFHSTTYQPNTISTLHLLRCLKDADPDFHAGISADLERIRSDPAFCAELFGRLFSRFLKKAMATLGFDSLQTRAAGNYIVVRGRKVFDGVAGVACSIRGHNPEGYLRELTPSDEGGDCRHLLTARLKELTGLGHLLPAVSGATAVENALRLALVAQHPRPYVLALEGGFGGKTLLALTGTARASYKSNLAPLYPHVLYIDPHAPNALAALQKALRDHPVAVVQVELIQAVGGVRPVPLDILRYLAANRKSGGYLLFVDEVQTGMYRTGPFLLSEKLGLAPDLVTIGKGTSDMMFPFALTLYSDALARRLDQQQPELPTALRRSYDYDTGYRTVLNVLRRAEELGLSDRVAQAGALFAEQLRANLASSKVVRNIRVHGLLIAIELDAGRMPLKRLRNLATWLPLFAMLRHQPFPLLIGYCQYEPNVLKLTPPLTITQDEVRQVCGTIAAVLNRSTYSLAFGALRAMTTSYLRRRKWREGPA